MKILKEETLYSGFLKLVKKTFSFNSAHSPYKKITHEREVLKVGTTVCAVLYANYSNEKFVLMMEQVRHIGRTIEGVCGFVEDGEDVTFAMLREIQEETGITITIIENPIIDKVGVFKPVSGILDMTTHIYAIKIPFNLLDENDDKIFGLEEEGEEVQNFVFPLDVAREQTNHPCTRIALDWIKENG